ncbi:MAG TPA: Uma2 family endonuclease, partial [Agitococcus sp.]|nr:Uma2 family endonuclease [Agitococcus sp.]
MANRVAKTAFISEADYLAGEKIAETKHEYIDGEVFAMAGASASHNRISLNVATLFNVH